MFGFLNRERKLVLSASETEVVLANVKSGKKGRNFVEVVASQEKESLSQPDLPSLVAGTGKDKAKVALVLPLKEFEIVSVTVPPISHEAVGKMLPYSLAKVLDSPVTDYIFDWQVAQSFKDRHELTVYLFPVSRFEEYRRDLQARQKEIAWFEPDVFAACSYLHSCKTGRKDNSLSTTSLCLLLWQNSVSIAVYENKRVSLVRTVEVLMPEQSPSGQTAKLDETAPVEDRTAVEGNETEELQEKIAVEEFLTAGEQDKEEEVVGLELEADLDESDTDTPEPADILAGFGLQAESVPEIAVSEDAVEDEFHLEEPEPEIEPETDPWTDYFESLNLEIMRTGDYHTSVLKGNPIQELFIGGAEQFYEAMEETVGVGQNLTVTRFPPENVEAKCSQTLAAICIGALQR